jgi:hypothetical protein
MANSAFNYSAYVTFDKSLALTGNSVTLDNDADIISKIAFYGGDKDAIKGWQNIPSGYGSMGGYNTAAITAGFPGKNIG